MCKRGYIRDDNKRCVAASDPADDCREKRWTWVGDHCVEPKCQPGPNEYRDDDGKCVCRGGYERDANKRCVKASDPANDCRKKGWAWNGKACVEPSDPAADCRKKGWAWNGKTCVEPSSPADDRRKKGWTWTGARCVEPANAADDCKKKGWTWNGKTCVEASNPATDCRKKGWTWTGTKCVEPQKKIETPKKTCPAGTVGTPPACKILQIRKCPPGTKGVFPRCTKG